MATLPIVNRAERVLLDDADAMAFTGCSFYLDRKGNVRGHWPGPGSANALPHLLLGPSADGRFVDHINGDRLDNRLENLRVTIARPSRPWAANRKVMTPKLPEVRFWKKVDRRGPNECWPWMACRQVSGHGQFMVNTRPRKLMPAHRFMWMITHGPIPDPEMKICHTCDHGWCVNPAHLFLGTQADNLRDCRKKGRHMHGERHYKAKLTADAVRFIRAAVKTGQRRAELGALFGITRTHVNQLITGHTWQHVSREAV